MKVRISDEVLLFLETECSVAEYTDFLVTLAKLADDPLEASRPYGGATTARHALRFFRVGELLAFLQLVPVVAAPDAEPWTVRIVACKRIPEAPSV